MKRAVFFLAVLTPFIMFFSTSCQSQKFEETYFRVPNDYTETVKTGGEIEAHYLKKGPYEVSDEWLTRSLRDWSLEVYFPSELKNPDNNKKYPVVFFVNGTAVPSFMYPALFEHLASWGFIVIGNDDIATKHGFSVDDSMDFIFNIARNDETSIFYNKIDFDNIGISGHSQGGVGLFNAITEGQFKDYFKCAVVLSPVGEKTARRLGWDYDTEFIKIPTAIFTGDTGKFETRVVIPPADLDSLYNSINAPKLKASKTGYTHRESHYVSDGYVTAWFMMYLQGDKEAAKAFTGEAPELLSNPLYKGQTLSIPE